MVECLVKTPNPAFERDSPEAGEPLNFTLGDSQSMGAVRVSKAVVKQLAWFFHRNGYVRLLNLERRSELGRQIYKKGDEARLVANSLTELAVIQRLLQAAGFKLGKPFQKGQQYRQPIYGRAEVARFLSMVGEPETPNPTLKRDAPKAARPLAPR